MELLAVQVLGSGCPDGSTTPAQSCMAIRSLAPQHGGYGEQAGKGAMQQWPHCLIVHCRPVSCRPLRGRGVQGSEGLVTDRGPAASSSSSLP